MSTAPQQTYLARTFDDGRYAWARRRPVRRRAVAAQVALFLALVVATLTCAATTGWSTWFFLVWTAGMLGFIPLHSLLNLSIRGVFDRSSRSMDEHQQELRERSYVAVAWPAWGLNFTAFAGAVTLVALTDEVGLGLCLGFLLWMAAGLLAYWHLAWTAPDEPADADL